MSSGCAPSARKIHPFVRHALLGYSDNLRERDFQDVREERQCDQLAEAR